MALDYGYPELAKKSESYEICFVPDNDYRGFLKRSVSKVWKKESMAAILSINMERYWASTKDILFIQSGSAKASISLLASPYMSHSIDPRNQYRDARR